MGFLYSSTSISSSNSPSACRRSNSTPTGDNSTRGTVERRDEMVEQPPVSVSDDMIYVLVGKDVKEYKLTLAWTLRNYPRAKICILHVHQPAKKIPILGTKFRISELEEHQVRAHHKEEREEMDQLLDLYVQSCMQAGVQAEKLLCIESSSIEEDIVQLIHDRGIKNVVMGAAADKHYSKKMRELKSKKAIYVHQRAPASCVISFICKGNLICTSDGRLHGVHPEDTESGQSSSLRSRSVTEGQNNQKRLIRWSWRGNSSAPDYRRVKSDSRAMKISAFSSPDGTGGINPLRGLSAEGSPDESQRFLSCSSTELLPHCEKDLPQSSPLSVLEGLCDELYDTPEQSMAEVGNSCQDTFGELVRRRKAEKSHINEANRRAKASESSHMGESSQTNETEGDLAEQLRVALEKNSHLESQVANTDKMVQELGEKIFPAAELLQYYQKGKALLV